MRKRFVSDWIAFGVLGTRVVNQAQVQLGRGPTRANAQDFFVQRYGFIEVILLLGGFALCDKGSQTIGCGRCREGGFWALQADRRRKIHSARNRIREAASRKSGPAPRCYLIDKLQCELHLARGPGAGDAAERRRAQSRARPRQVDMIRSVEHLPPELNVLGLCDVEVLHQTRVENVRSGRVKNSDRRVAELRTAPEQRMPPC